MIGAVVTLLVIAGTIEACCPPRRPAIWKYGVSAATAVLLIFYLMNGRKYRTSLLFAPCRIQLRMVLIVALGRQDPPTAQRHARARAAHRALSPLNLVHQ